MTRLLPQPLSRKEQEELTVQIRNGLSESEITSLVVFGPANITYLTAGIVLPFADQECVHKTALVRNSNKNVILCAPEFHQVVLDQGWDQDVTTYLPGEDHPTESFLNKLIEILQGQHFKQSRIAGDYNFIPHAHLERLKAALPHSEWTSCDAILSRLRMQKTQAEIRMLETAVRIGDRAFVSALNHSEASVHDAVGYSVWEFAERVRVHVGEFGGSATGHVMASQGESCRDLYCLPEKDVTLEPGRLGRCEWTNHNFGYWADSSRTFSIGRSTEEQRQAYAANLYLKKVAVEQLRPGIKSCDVFHAVERAAKAEGISFWGRGGIGHGVGTSEWEAPFLSPNESTILQSGMVVVVGVYSLGPSEELICSKDTYVITDEARRLLSWYKTYDELYELVGATARHG
jgi:Xaa-Pro aminopeptidase